MAENIKTMFSVREKPRRDTGMVVRNTLGKTAGKRALKYAPDRTWFRRAPGTPPDGPDAA